MSHILNVEIKAKSSSLSMIRDIIKNSDHKEIGVDHQIDTYFFCSHGRLKLRSGNIENTLIFYSRNDHSGPKQSHIVLSRLSQGNDIKDVLKASNGVMVEVDKKREIYFIDNVKFHLDTVNDLGTFIEIEAIDKTGEIGDKKLFEQCQYYMKLFSIADDALIHCSYSDLLMEKNIHKEAQVFLEKIFCDLSKHKLDFSGKFLDHICYRVTSEEEYGQMKNLFAKMGVLLIESEIGGRLISTFKLNNPIKYQERDIRVVELPQPKKDNKYPKGFEHAEFVTQQSFESFQNDYNNLKFDTGGIKKEHNPELRVILSNQLSIKLHHRSLEDVIISEIAQNSRQ